MSGDKEGNILRLFPLKVGENRALVEKSRDK